jgi:hypothetical protein|tara:strand:+ start:4646 stop:5158 length:513 start_codon:yes stop_codon:yes gene_type:complete
VTDNAVGWRAVVAVTIDALRHLERFDLLDYLHSAYVAVAGRAHGRRRNPVSLREKLDVGLVNEVNVVRHPVDAHPIDGFAFVERLSQFGDLGQSVSGVIIADCQVACHTQAHGRNCRGGSGRHSPVAESAIQPEDLDVGWMREGYRLRRSLVIAENYRLTNPSRYHERND